MKTLKSTDLRIGNFVNDVGGMTFRVSAQCLLHLVRSEAKGKINLGYNPVPLTEEILLKFGFKKTTENAGQLICFKMDIVTHSNRTFTIAEWIKSDKGHWQIWIESMDLTRIAFVHQLQNLYFDLTGQELNYDK